MSTAERAARADADTDGAAGEPCSAPLDAEHPDLTWLLHRAAQHMRIALDEAAKAHGLTGARDWIVLSAIGTGTRQTQLSLAQSLGLDKTTMTSLLDRMEARGQITRCLDSHDRRARIPELTETGKRIQAEVTRARNRVEADLLSNFTDAEQRQLRELLARLAAAPNDHGSCI
jgi:MarR family transcriptional regulator, organic hydroperoxide resistance regulator